MHHPARYADLRHAVALAAAERAIQRLIQDPLALKILEGEVTPGETVEVDADLKKGEMTFAPAKAKAAQG